MNASNKVYHNEMIITLLKTHKRGKNRVQSWLWASTHGQLDSQSNRCWSTVATSTKPTRSISVGVMRLSNWTVILSFGHYHQLIMNVPCASYKSRRKHWPFYHWGSAIFLGVLYHSVDEESNHVTASGHLLLFLHGTFQELVSFHVSFWPYRR